MAQTLDPSQSQGKSGKKTVATIAAEHSKYDFQQLIYPLELENDPGLGHYIIFHINESSGSKFKTSLQETKDLGEGDVGTLAKMAGVSVSSKGDLASKNQPLTRRTLGLDRTTVRSKRAIILYMPAQLSTTYGFQYEDTDLSGAVALRTGAGAVISKWKSLYTDEKADTSAATELAKKKGVKVVQSVADAGASMLGLGGVQGLVGAATRQVTNPHMNVLFKTVDPRTFSYEFDFMPKSEDEAQVVHNIVTAFKFYAHPELQGNPGTGGYGTFWTFPGEFEIEFYSHGVENKFLHKQGVCVCTGISVNYAPDGQVALHKSTTSGGGYTTGNPPVRTTLSVSFKEIELLTKERIAEGY